ncbi:MAG: RNA-binding domain-containing protein [Candidatus Methanomethylophilaceae archaeon]|nr:RNA-binding domain-containing protein [Candidatus Methanomethylophilaceae archaeon]
MVTVNISCPVFPSEDLEKVKTAILNIFPKAELEEVDSIISGTADIVNFSNLIRKQEILDSTRSVMRKGICSHKTTIYLNKQVATVGKISFTEERTILGTITVTIGDEDIDGLIDRVAPQTVDGREVRI